MNPPEYGFSTRAIHSSYDSGTYSGALNVPIFLSSTFEFENMDEAMDTARGVIAHPIYNRCGCPTNEVLERRIAELEGGEAGLSFSSGMGAISAAMWTILKKGDHVLVSSTIYGCTVKMFDHFKEFGVDVEMVPFVDADDVVSHLRPDTRLVYFETPANPTNDVIDIRKIAAAAHEKCANVIVVADNTFSTPAITRPLELGCDLVVHSATKYLSGHGDIVAGLLVGKQDMVTQIRNYGLKDMTGAVLAPLDAHLLLRGIKTLELRMERHGSNALTLAVHLAKHPKVSSVMFPWLETSPYHELARSQMAMPHAIVCFELKGTRADAARFMDSLKLCKRAVSLGDCETLVQHPASMTHSPLTPEELKSAGISETLIRVSVGLEDIKDILADFDQALEKL